MLAAFRYKHGDTKPVMHAVAADAEIAIGDLLYVATTAKPASALTWDTNLATTQETFKDTFLGVACQKKAAADTTITEIRVATAGVFEFDCASASFAVGALVGPAKQSGNALENQKVAAVADETLAVGRVHKATSSATTVEVSIESSVMAGGTQAVA